MVISRSLNHLPSAQSTTQGDITAALKGQHKVDCHLSRYSGHGVTEGEWRVTPDTTQLFKILLFFCIRAFIRTCQKIQCRCMQDLI